ncbi:MAG: hypothetical protein NZ870_01020, partial [bacterium]|nr:hypothetical protein [bacterium]
MFLYLGKIYELEGYPDEAILNFRRYIANRKSVEAKVHLANLLYETRNDEASLIEAKELYLEALKSTNST